MERTNERKFKTFSLGSSSLVNFSIKDFLVCYLSLADKQTLPHWKNKMKKKSEAQTMVLKIHVLCYNVLNDFAISSMFIWKDMVELFESEISNLSRAKTICSKSQPAILSYLFYLSYFSGQIINFFVLSNKIKEHLQMCVWCSICLRSIYFKHLIFHW